MTFKNKYAYYKLFSNDFLLFFHVVTSREIIDLGNLLIHEYFGIDTKIVWDIITTDIVSLKPQIKEIIEQL